jgi:hypothetical protein
MTLAFIYWLSFAALIITKVADVVSTIRWVSPTAETNPWARRLFRRFGFKGGLIIVSIIFLLIVVTQYASVWWYGSSLAQAANAGLGFIISFIQWDVARFNATGVHSRITLLAMRYYARWNRWWRR